MIEDSIKKALKEISEDEDVVSYHGFNNESGYFVVTKRKHEVSPILIRGFDVKEEKFFDKFQGCTDVGSAQMFLQQITL